MNQEILDELQKENLEQIMVKSIKEQGGKPTLRNTMVQLAGEKFNPKNEEVTVDMIVQLLAEDFPEIVFAIAEENYLKGFEEGLNADELYEEDPRAQQVLNDMKDE